MSVRSSAVALFLVSLFLVSMADPVLAVAAGPPPSTVSIVWAPRPVSPQAAGATWALLGMRSPALDGEALVYDSAADRFILFGGAQTVSGGFTNATWSYSYATNIWTNITPKVSPSPRGGHMMVYDSKADRVVLFGGESFGGSISNETWVFDYGADTWTMKHPTAEPSGRVFGAMSFDPVANMSVLTGGLSSTFTPISDTWGYNLSADTWVSLATVSPSARYGSMMAYDASAQRDILFGGGYVATNFTFVNLFDTYAYDFATRTWTNRAPVAHPSGRAVGSLSFDSVANRSILFGGGSMTGLSTTVHNDTWAYDYAHNAWANVTPVSSPSPRELTAQAFSPVANRTVLFGGATSTGTPNDEAWAFGYAPGLPSSPLNLAAAAGTGQVTLTWSAPASDGGSSITGYAVYRGTTSGGETPLTTLGTVLTYQDTGVTGGTTYYYEVAAITSVGTGPKSNEASATPAVTPAVPSAPQNPAASAGNALVTLTWSAPASTGSSAVTNYKVYRGTTSGSETVLATVGNVLTYADSTVTNGVTYYYEVSAVNTAGEGPKSTEVHATPTAPADTTPPSITIVSPGNGTTVSSTAVTVTGTASDDVAVQKVELSTDGTNWVAATGTTSWSGSLTLTTGTNTVHARATDTSGNTKTVWITVTVSTGTTNAPLGVDPLLLAAIVIVVVIAALAVALVLVRRRKKQAPPPTAPPPPTGP